jgi:hypothetical protein
MDQSLGDYFRSQAEWRAEKAAEHPEDERNAQSAAALRSLAEFVDHEVDSFYVHELEPHLIDGGLGGERAQRDVSRYGWDYPPGHQAFLLELIVACFEDAYERAGDTGEDPTGRLTADEVAAAQKGRQIWASYWGFHVVNRLIASGGKDAFRDKVRASLLQAGQEPRARGERRVARGE